jgi:hypothetical protein
MAASAQKEPPLQHIGQQVTVSVGQHRPVVGLAHSAAAEQQVLPLQPTVSVGQHRLVGQQYSKGQIHQYGTPVWKIHFSGEMPTEADCGSPTLMKQDSSGR